MGGPASTRPSLLIRIRDSQDAEAWRQFVELYGPLIYQFARKQRLQDADAADLTQIVLSAVSDGIKRLDYNPRVGSFRGWLFRVVRNQLNKLRTRQRKEPRASGDSTTYRLLENQASSDYDQAELWNREYERQLFHWAAARVRRGFEESSWNAFWQTAVLGKSAPETAQALGLSVGAVSAAKSRILDRIRREIQEADGDEAALPEGGDDGRSILS